MYPHQASYLDVNMSLSGLRKTRKLSKPFTYFCLVSSFSCSESWPLGFDILVLTASDFALTAESLISEAPC